MHVVDFIPSNWLERSASAASYGQVLMVYARPVKVERRQTIRRSADRVQKFQSLRLEDLV